MSYYDLSWNERRSLDKTIESELREDIEKISLHSFLKYFSDTDTYIRKSAYLAVGRIYLNNNNLINAILKKLHLLSVHGEPNIRQTTINAAGEIGKYDFEQIKGFLDIGLFDQHHAVRNAVIGSMKKIGEVNPIPLLSWAKTYLHHEDKEIRREICHGIELRGRTHPQDILPLLRELEFDKTSRVRKTLVHVLGQIAYKKDCLQTVLKDLENWKNNELIQEALKEIVDVHKRYQNFSNLTQEEVIKIIENGEWTNDNGSISKS